MSQQQNPAVVADKIYVDGEDEDDTSEAPDPSQDLAAARVPTEEKGKLHVPEELKEKRHLSSPGHEVRVVFHDYRARLPSRAHDRDAAFDLFAIEDRLVSARSRMLISTGLELRLPHEHFALLCSRSGLSSDFGIEVGAGIVGMNFKNFNYSRKQCKKMHFKTRHIEGSCVLCCSITAIGTTR